MVSDTLLKTSGANSNRKIKKLGIRKQRMCLHCSSMFDSWGAANRICKTCLPIVESIKAGTSDIELHSAKLRTKEDEENLFG